MATQEERRSMQNRGVLTADDRAFYRGEKDVDDEDKVAREKRHNVRQRIEKLSEDLRLLREAEEDQVIAEFYDEVGRHNFVKEEVKEELLAELADDIGHDE